MLIPSVKPKTIAIQLVILLVLLGAIELGAKIFEPYVKRPQVELMLNMHPYMMFGANSGSGFTWYDIFTKEKVPSNIVFNNYGFSETFDYSVIPTAEYMKEHGKKPGEKIVLLTGGSVVHGVGATGNDKTISAQMQRYLNEHSADKSVRYRVLNMGMGSWIAYQQFIGLSLFGLPFQPDWVISMDGHNDAAVPCAHGSGASNPLGWPKMLYLTQGGGGTQQASPTIEALARHSALVRVVTGVQPSAASEIKIPSGLTFDTSDPDPRFLIKLDGLTVEEQDKQMDFYVQAQRDVIALFNKANIIMSSQPLMYNNAITPAFRATFGPDAKPQDRAELAKALDEYMSKNKKTGCRSDLSPQLLGYFMGRSALRLGDLANSEQKKDPSRKILYINTEWSMPMPEEIRKPFFVDNAHMSDRGQQRVGELFAEMILAAEKNKPFDYKSFIDSRDK